MKGRRDCLEGFGGRRRAGWVFFKRRGAGCGWRGEDWRRSRSGEVGFMVRLLVSFFQLGQSDILINQLDERGCKTIYNSVDSPKSPS